MEACADAGEAQRRIAEAAPDLVLVDFAMPVCNGAARQVQANRPEQRIVFVSGYAESEQLDTAFGRGAAALRKSFSLNKLTTIIGDQLGLLQSD